MTATTSRPPPEEQPAAGQGEWNLQARQNTNVFQAAGDQYIYEPPLAMAAASNTLPRNTAAFTGRDRELASLVASVTAHLEGGTAIPVHAIDGMPGVGKSALAVHVGHKLEHRFPDGQFFINLRAHAAAQDPVPPGDALFALLTAAGIAATQVPADVDARAAMWRSRLAGRRAVIVLDDAADRGQVEPLLPGAPGCLVLVTSRRRLTGLTASHAATNLALETLPPGQAAELFATMSGRSANGPGGDAIREVAALCGYLPLAICLLAARLRPEPRWPVSDLVGELTRAKHRVAHMYADDVAVAAAFDLSCRRLPAARRRLFRRLGLHPGTDIDAYAAAALDSVTPAAALRHLNELYHDHLLDQPRRGRYTMHDLVRDYTRTLAEREPVAERRQAVARLVTYYQAGVVAAERQLGRPKSGATSRTRTVAGTSSASANGPPLPDMALRTEALTWMRTELPNLLACARTLAATVADRSLVDLAAAMATYLRHAGPWDHAASLHESAGSAAERLGEPAAQAAALRELGVIQGLSGHYADADHTLSAGYDIFAQLGQRRDMADTLVNRATVRRRAGDHRSAARQLEDALTLFASEDDPRGQADTLIELGVVRHLDGDHDGAVAAFREALALHRERGDLHGQAAALTQWGCAEQLTGEYPTAVQAYRQALDIYGGLGDRHGLARALNYLGVVFCQIGSYDGARRALTEALGIHGELGYRAGQANALRYLGIVHYRAGDVAAAERLLAQALVLHQQLGAKDAEADTLHHLGGCRRLDGDHDGAAQAHTRALDIYRQLADELGQAEVHNGLGDLHLARGDPGPALDQFRRALRLAQRARSPREEAAAMEGSGLCALRLGDRRTALAWLRKARAVYERIGALHAVQVVDGVLADLPEDEAPAAPPAND